MLFGCLNNLINNTAAYFKIFYWSRHLEGSRNTDHSRLPVENPEELYLRNSSKPEVDRPLPKPSTSLKPAQSVWSQVISQHVSACERGQRLSPEDESIIWSLYSLLTRIFKNSLKTIRNIQDHMTEKQRKKKKAGKTNRP